MILSPTDLQLEKIEQIQTSTGYVNKVTISFLPPFDIDLAGYNFFYSFDNLNYIKLEIHLDKDLKKEENRTFIEQTFTNLFDGRDIWISLSAFTTYNLESAMSSSINFETKVTPPNIERIYFDTKKVTLEISDLNTSTGINSKFTSYKINKYNSKGVKYTIISLDSTNIIFSSANFIIGEKVRVHHLSRNVIWEGFISTEGIFIINDNNKLIDDYLFKYEKSSLGDFNIYIKNLLLNTTNISTNIFTDTIFTLENFYFYEVSSLTSTTESIKDIKSIFIKDLTKSFPVLRLLEQSNVSTLKKSWRDMKETLWDQNYYDKRDFALPFIEELSFLIYIGIYNIKIDVWLNDEYQGAYNTDKNGELTIPLILRKGDSKIKMRLRNKDNTIINNTTFSFNLKTYLKYIFFVVFGILLSELETEISNTKKVLFLDTTNYLDRFADLVSVFRIFEWSKDEFRETIKKLILAFKYNATVKGIEEVIESFNAVNSFWVWEYLEPERNIRVGDLCTSTGLINRENYTYGVSACKYNGEETTVTTLNIDSRWHSFDYFTVNYFEWDKVEGADFYKIYRSSSGSISPLYFLTSTGSNKWIDHNTTIPNYNLNPITLNYSSMKQIKNLKRKIIPKNREKDFYFYSGGYLRIIIGGIREFYNKEKELIFSLIRRIIPSELKLEIYFATNNNVWKFDQKYVRGYGFD